MIARDNLLAKTQTGATATDSTAGRVTWSFASPTATPPGATASAPMPGPAGAVTCPPIRPTATTPPPAPPVTPALLAKAFRGKLF